jgi:hypothetical protein
MCGVDDSFYFSSMDQVLFTGTNSYLPYEKPGA